MSESKTLGRWGEARAASYLKRKLYRIVETNYSTRFGEVDIVAETWNYIVFAEVKLRKNADFAEAAEYVDVHKQRRIIAAAQRWLMQNPTSKQPRFDVIEVYAADGINTRRPVVRHIENAFDGDV